MTHVTDHPDRAVSRLLAQYKGKVGIESLLRVYAEQIQKLDDAAFAFWAAFTLAAAAGEQLDFLGAIVGQPREGRTDAVYRTWIQARAALNRCNGTAPELLAIAAQLAPGAAAGWSNRFPAGFRIALTGVAVVYGEEIAKVLKLAKAGGVESVTYWHPAAPAALFTFGGDGGTQGFDVGVLAGEA